MSHTTNILVELLLLLLCSYSLLLCVQKWLLFCLLFFLPPSEGHLRQLRYGVTGATWSRMRDPGSRPLHLNPIKVQFNPTPNPSPLSGYCPGCCVRTERNLSHFPGGDFQVCDIPPPSPPSPSPDTPGNLSELWCCLCRNRFQTFGVYTLCRVILLPFNLQRIRIQIVFSSVGY